MSTTCEDDARVDALMHLMSSLSVQENSGWIDAVVINDEDGKLYFHPERFAIPLSQNEYVPMPEHACVEMDRRILQRTVNEAWRKMAQMPLFAALIMPAPTVATMMTGFKSDENIQNLDIAINQLGALYGELMEKHEGDANSFYDTEQARGIIDAALMATSKRDVLLKTHKKHKPVGWEPITSTVSVFLYYSRLIDIFSVSVMFTPEHMSAERKTHQQRLDMATKIMYDNIDKAAKTILSDPELSSAISCARHNTAGITPLGVDYDVVCPIVEKGCIEFTYAVLAEMERWILTMVGIPSELHSCLLCTAQPKINFAAGKLNADGINWQEDLRDIRKQALGYIWEDYTFDEEFSYTNARQIDVPHISRVEYQASVFNTLVRMSYTDETHMDVLRQYSLRMKDPLDITEMSPVLCTPIILYDTQGNDHINCAEAFNE